MMKPIWSVSLIATAIVLGTVCTARGQTTADEQAVVNFYKYWSAATMKEGPEGYARFFAADGVLLPPDSPPVSGRAAIRDWMQRTLAESKYVTRPEGVNQDDLKVTGNMAVARSTLRGKRIPKAGGDPLTFETKYLDVLRRTSEGRWEFVNRMWNSNIRP